MGKWREMRSEGVVCVMLIVGFCFVGCRELLEVLKLEELCRLIFRKMFGSSVKIGLKGKN